MPDSIAPQGAVAAEQPRVTRMYDRLDELTARATRDLSRARRATTAGTPAAMVEREAMIRAFSERLTGLVSAERRLCFGRLDPIGGEVPLYIGRMSLADDEQVLMLSDWRAPVAEPFYRATAAEPMGIARRRHLLLEGREVVAVEDDLLDLESASDSGYEGSGALMAALAAKRTGRMGDIVATIQAEQDRIIRSPLAGILVVEGGPGCGKTVVGLHRAAFLLYTHREQIARSGVLVIGPNPLFLRYISQVLPALGESSAVLATPAQLYPGVEGVPEVDDAVAALKGDIDMVEVLAQAVRNRQRVPDVGRTLTVAGTRLTLTPGMVATARDRARASRKPHNQARRTFVLALLDRLVAVLASARGVDADSNRDILLADLRDSPDARREINLCWMPLTPEQLVADLWSDPHALALAAPRLSATDRRLLGRPRGTQWTISDVPLLDEAAELIGEDDEPARRAAAIAASERASEMEYARGVLEMTGVQAITADALIERYSGVERVHRTVADSALMDRGWGYGHVVVDEAQELSMMQWRVLMRRCPSRSMTVVGDSAQAGSAAAPSDWAAVFDRLVPGRWSVERLTVNYRTPEPIMSLAVSVLRGAGLEGSVTRSVRDGSSPVVRRVQTVAGYGEAFARVIAEELAEFLPHGGRAAVLTTPVRTASLAAGLSKSFPSGSVGGAHSELAAPISVLTVAQAKGLEFDRVIVVEPSEIVAASRRGINDLYVALTRSTSTLSVVHSLDLPAGFLD